MRRRLAFGVLLVLAAVGLFGWGLGRTNSGLHAAAAARRLVREHLGPEARIVSQQVHHHKGPVWAVEGVVETARGQEEFNLILRYAGGEYRPITATFGGQTAVFRR